MNARDLILSAVRRAGKPVGADEVAHLIAIQGKEVRFSSIGTLLALMARGDKPVLRRVGKGLYEVIP